MVFALGAPLPAQQDQIRPPPFRACRYDEDWAYLRDPGRRGDAWWEPLKCVPLDPAADVWLSFGDEVRVRYERFAGDRWGDADPPDHDYWWLRTMPCVDLHLGDSLRAFAQVVAAFEFDDEGGRSPIDEDRADILQAFVDASLPLGDCRLTARVGRQVLGYGSERLISTRYGPNVLRAFDVVRLIAEHRPWRVDLFCGRPVAPKPGTFDDAGDPRASVWGAYATVDLGKAERSGLDLYYIGRHRDRATFDQGTAASTRHTLGTRWFGAAAGWDWNCEAFGQFGTFGAGDVRAWSVASDTGCTFDRLPTTPRLGLRADVISGDRDRGDADLSTFDPLFPKGKYFGEMGLIGPLNLYDLHPSCTLQLGGGWSAEGAAVMYWRQSAADGIYDNGGGLLRSGAGSGARFVGSQFDATLTYAPDRAVSVSVSWSTFQPGAFLRQTGAAQTVQFVGTEFAVVF